MSEYLERAQAIFDRYVGYKIGETSYSDVLRYNNGATLKAALVTGIQSVKARASQWEFENIFGKTEWVDINVGNVILIEKDGKSHIVLPHTLFGTSYSEVDVTYTAGLKTVPKDVRDAVLEIANLLEGGHITEWNCMLPVPVLDVIEKYRKEVI